MMMKYAVLLIATALLGCPKKTEAPTKILDPEPPEFDLLEDDDLDDLPEAGDTALKDNQDED